MSQFTDLESRYAKAQEHNRECVRRAKALLEYIRREWGFNEAKESGGALRYVSLSNPTEMTEGEYKILGEEHVVFNSGGEARFTISVALSAEHRNNPFSVDVFLSRETSGRKWRYVPSGTGGFEVVGDGPEELKPTSDAIFSDIQRQLSIRYWAPADPT